MDFKRKKRSSSEWTDLRIRRIFFSNADSQQYILIIRIDRMISDMIFTRWSITSKIFVLQFHDIDYTSSPIIIPYRK